jgi:hypothetical protein
MNLAVITTIINVTRPRFLQALRPLCLYPHCLYPLCPYPLCLPPLVLLLIKP